jgi:hypothetical protein
LVPPIFHKATHPSEQSGGASSPPDAFATYDIRAAALPGNPYDGHTLGTVIPHASAHRQRARSLHHRCRLSPPQRLPDHKFKVYTTGPEVPRNAADQARVQTADAIEPRPPPQGNATAWAAITLPMPFSPPPATTFAAYPRGLTFSGRARRRCHSLVSLSDAAVSREI